MPETEGVSKRVRTAMLWVAAVRIVLGIVAIPLAPLLYKDHFLLLVLLRPTKEVFLAGGFLARRGDVDLLELVLAAIPLSILAVWLFFYLGRAYASEIKSEKLPGIASRILTPDRIKRFSKALDKRGAKLIFLGRLAVLSSATVAAAAGAAKLEPKKFLPWDLAGGLVSIGYTVGAGYALGEAYERAGPWLTVVGAIAFVGFAYILGRALKK
jgi:membrane protein DedA with SNARE-associated domain